MTSVMESTQDLMDVFAAKLKDFSNEIDDVHIVWLEEIGQAALKMFSSDFSTEPELMPKTPSQKKSSRRRRVSVGQTESKAKKGLSKSRRSNLRRSSAHQAGLLPIHEDLAAPEEDATEEEPQRKTRRNNNTTKAARGKQNAAAAPSEDEAPQEEEGMTTEPSSSDEPPQVSQAEEADAAQSDVDAAAVVPDTPTGPPVRNSVRRSTASRRSLAGLRRSLTQEAVRRASRRSFLKKKARLSRSASSSVTGDDIVVDTDGEEVEAIQGDEVFEEVEPAISLSPVPDETVEPDMAKDAEQPDPEPPRYTRSMARNTPTDASTVSLIVKAQTPSNAPDNSTKAAGTQSASRFGFKRKVDPAEDAPKKKASPRATQSAVKPNMKSFIHTVQKNQLLMMTPGSAGRSSVMSFIKHSTPGRVDPKLSVGLVERERLKLEAYNKKTAQEVERKKKMEEERKRRNDEVKRQRDERVRRVLEARERGAREDQEKKKKLEQKMAQIKEREEAKKTVASKRQQELELRRKQEEEAKKKKEEEEALRQAELRAKKKAEEEERARKLAEARRQLELKKERERELERQAAAEREREEREKALALRMEVERAAREKERRELEEKRRREEEQRKAEALRQVEEEKRRAAAAAAAAARDAQFKATASTTTAALNTTINKGPALNVTVDLESTVTKTPVTKGAALYQMAQKNAGLNVTVDIEKTMLCSPINKAPESNRTILLSPVMTSDIEKSPQSYEITPKGVKITTLANPEDYGMDQNSDDSTDDESAPKKPIPSWAEGLQLQQAVMKQYYDPVDLLAHFGAVEMPKLETIFHKSKPRFFKRTSSAVWHSPPRMGSLA